jgi:hypothetical protein
MALLAAAIVRSEEPREALDFFEREVRPVLVEKCFKCHGADKQESNLRLDSRARLIQGGETGPAVVAGDPERSLLIAAIRQEGDIQMPPQGKLTDSQIAAITHWVKLGAPWPGEVSPGAGSKNPSRSPHWAFQPVQDPPVPIVDGNASSNPIDAFVKSKLAAAGLSLSPVADGRTLARRVSYGLTGLPPAEYGEHWGRHWLDLARYSDTKGYVYAREQRFWIHAWVYRDWIVNALNDDLPYDRFLLLQIAADQAEPQDKSSLAAMGFLTIGRRFLGVSREIIDDRIDVVTRGTMGLTVSCARCHDHKYDPIPTRDYYSLYGVFQSCAEKTSPIAEPGEPDEAFRKYAVELAERQKKLSETMAARRLETADRNRARAGDYLAAQLELHKYPVEGFDQILAKTDLLPTFVWRWQGYLDRARKSADPVFMPWHAYAGINVAEFTAEASRITSQLASLAPDRVNPLVREKFVSAPASMVDVAARYGEVFAMVDAQWREGLKSAGDGQQPPTELPDDAAEAVRQVLYGATGPCEVPDEPIVNIEYLFDSGTCDELWKLQNQVEELILKSPPGVRYAAVLQDRDPPTTPRVFRRGDPANPGDEVPRQFVGVVAGSDRRPFSSGSGRLELARAIVDPRNPLTARVIVNRVWAHHFGAGLVRTPSDFGTRADPPSHPELLDWLASRLIEDGWSLKKLHRRILLSESYRQSSRGLTDEPANSRASRMDPENRLLCQMNERRLSFEEMRDSMLSAAGLLDRSVGGRAGDLLSRQFTRRTLYGTIDRQFLPSTLRVFDFANPDLHIPQRGETTVPQQALFFLNHSLIVGYAKALAARTAESGTDEDRVQRLFMLAYQRRGTPEQMRSALDFVQRAADEELGSDLPATARAWRYGYGEFDEASRRVTRFVPLPHFTGAAWQGGTAYPDGGLGWLQLTAGGGHPGNDRAHAAIRRWTAPRDMRIHVKSTLIHEPKEGEGVRGFVVSSRAGLLAQALVHHGQAELAADTLPVQAGDVLDFVADIGNKLSHNQFLWKIRIQSTDEPAVDYDGQRDFSSHGIEPLGPWEQLAQVLLAANEFVFVD